jgi:hypothetical protein
MPIDEQDIAKIQAALDKIRQEAAADIDRTSRELASQLAEALLGPIPSYSGRRGLPEQYSITPTTTLHAASYALCWHGDKKDPDVVLIKRRERNRNGDIQIGMPGCFLNPDYVGDARPPGSTPQNTPGEMQEVAARRELIEETMKPNNALIEAVKSGTLPEDEEERQTFIENNSSPVIIPDVDRFKYASSTIDYRRFVSPATYNETYALELTAEEFRALQSHQRNMNDPDYRAAANVASGGEINGLQIVKLSALQDIMRENRRIMAEHQAAIDTAEINPGILGAFAHPHEIGMIDEFSIIRFSEQERDYIDRFLFRAKEELSHRIPPPIGDKWDIAQFADRWVKNIEQSTLGRADISASIRIPSRQEAHNMATYIVNQLLPEQLGNDAIREYIGNAVHRMVDIRFYPPGQLRGWEQERQVNGRTVRLTAIGHDEFPISQQSLTPAAAEATRALPDAVLRVNNGIRILRNDPIEALPYMRNGQDPPRRKSTLSP